MVGSLKSSAGIAFHEADVLQRFHLPIAAEQAVLDRYVFLPHARSGIAAALTAPFAWGGPAEGSVTMRVPVQDDRGALAAEMTVKVYGPGHVAELAVRQVIRTWPKADAPHAEIDDLVQIEFDRPELPWLFTPAAPAAGRLVPWLSLVVARRGAFEWAAGRGTLRVAEIRRDQLQPLHDAWAWAHAQVMGAKASDPGAQPTLEQRLSGTNARFNLSRLLCPRRLEPDTPYTAFVVPTFTAGVNAALGLSRVTTLEPAWGVKGSAADFRSGDPQSMVTLPVFYAWSFATGAAGNFESLARKIFPRVAPPGVGRRRVDATHPWPGTALDGADPGAELVVRAPVVSPTEPTDDPQDKPSDRWPAEAAQHWPAGVTEDLVAKLNLADVQAHRPEEPGSPPLVGPPLYGGTYARQARIENEPAPAAAQPEWFRQLNLDPRHRIVAGLGTRVVQHDQEALMASAWNQVIGVEEANRQLRLAQFARHVAAVLHRRHLARLSEASLVKVTERVHGKLLDQPEVTVWSSVAASALPTAAVSGTYRRMLRTRGPIVHAASLAADAANGAAGAAVDGLTARADGLTESWVLPYTLPDGLAGLSPSALARITPELLDQVATGADPEAFVEELRGRLKAPGAEQLATPDLLERIDLAALRPAAHLADVGVVGILARMPAPPEIEGDREAAGRALAAAVRVRALIRAGFAVNLADYRVGPGLVRRLDLPATRDDDPSGRLLLRADALTDWIERLIALARRQLDEVPLDQIEDDANDLQRRLLGHLERGGELAGPALLAVTEDLVRVDEFADGARPRIPVSGLNLVARLDPAVLVPARVTARLSAGTGRLPGWLRPDWFADARIEPVMACPRFDWPMYEALDRYDRDWLIPGLALIQRPDMATLLQTNNQFLEAFLVGLNHEMGRELLWREYPTDQRGTYFRSFWTGDPELQAELHELPWRTGPLGSHVDPALDGQIVLLVRGELIQRFPGVVAHAVRQAQDILGPPIAVNGVPVFEPGKDDSPRKTLFRIHLAPNILLVGFALTRAEIEADDVTWWFTLSENPTEPRFGLDESRTVSPPPQPPPTRDDLVWADFGTPLGGFLDAAAGLPIQFPVDATPGADVSRWGRSSAEVASLLFQLPARAAYLGRRMMAGQPAPGGGPA